MSTTRAWPVRRSLDELLAGALGVDHTEAAPDLQPAGVEVHVPPAQGERLAAAGSRRLAQVSDCRRSSIPEWEDQAGAGCGGDQPAVPVTNLDRKSTRLNSSHANISYAVFCLKKKKYILI